ncbi:MAG TPA: Holliday junction branch migration protein RuvA [Chlamydiales bacterium]|nr:Holliday junction branch migration protein RuvA [Chlamydiales bacterium]
MYEYIQGKLIEKRIDAAIIETHGVAYKILIPLSSFHAIHPGNVLLYTSFQVKEDSQSLYGFVTKQDRDLFELLITISGIGPKTALALVGHLDFSTFQTAIANANVLLLSKVPGIGKKTAERLIIEMKDKFKKILKDLPPLPAGPGSMMVDAINALIHLGYNPLESHKAVQKAHEEKKGSSDLASLISYALQKI